MKKETYFLLVLAALLISSLGSRSRRSPASEAVENSTPLQQLLTELVEKREQFKSWPTLVRRETQDMVFEQIDITTGEHIRERYKGEQASQMANLMPLLLESDRIGMAVAWDSTRNHPRLIVPKSRSNLNFQELTDCASAKDEVRFRIKKLNISTKIRIWEHFPVWIERRFQHLSESKESHYLLFAKRWNEGSLEVLAYQVYDSAPRSGSDSICKEN